MDETLLKALMQAGPFGIIAALVLWFYREDRKSSEQRYTTLLEGSNETIKENTQSNKELAQVNTRLCTIIEYHASTNGNGRRPPDKH
jgi:hypothetical protein